MQAHTIVILTSGLTKKVPSGALDRAIVEFVKRKKTPFLVLGVDGDDILESCERLDDAELVFDPNDPGDEPGASKDMFSAVKAGLYGTNAGTFVWRLDRPFPTEEVWTRLETTLRLDDEKKTDVYGCDGDPSDLLLITARGNKLLRERHSDNPWPVAQDIVFTRLFPT